tara:strand:- start:1582 stop:3330 length:1749 start_codon:yes stop_codon:yes gene_type:complete
MSFSKNDLELIKSKIILSQEIEKKTKVIKKGKDSWCCCLFHEEKTPSCKINDDLGSYYCFGCGAKGDIFTIYTELYNFSFPEAVKELAQRAGVRLIDNFDENINKKNDRIYKVLEISAKWFQDNLYKSNNCKKYLYKRNLSDETIKYFKLGFSSNPKKTLYEFLKEQNFNDAEMLESNVVKLDRNNKVRDFFYNRLMFPIANEYGKIVGFGGRVLDNSNPKYINSPESDFFKKRNILYNLYNAKQIIRSKKNMLICEGYMDVISLYDKNIKTAVAPLGTSLTDNHLLLSWKYVNKPTLMFDGDTSGIKASFKSAIMSLPYLNPSKLLQFVILPNNYDPDTYINEFSLNKFATFLKNPLSIVDFIFQESSKSIDLRKSDNKIIFDKYIEEIVSNIKDSKIKYFYKNEFKTLFFEKLKSFSSKKKSIKIIPKTISLKDKQIYSFLTAYLNHIQLRTDLYLLLIDSKLLNNNQLEFLNYVHKSEFVEADINNFDISKFPKKLSEIYENSQDSGIFQLFPYVRADYDSEKTIKEIRDSINNLKTRLSNLKKINKSLNDIEINSSSMTWDELKNITFDLHNNEELLK